jgi:hypothetical protein
MSAAEATADTSMPAIVTPAAAQPVVAEQIGAITARVARPCWSRKANEGPPVPLANASVTAGSEAQDELFASSGAALLAGRVKVVTASPFESVTTNNVRSALRASTEPSNRTPSA